MEALTPFIGLAAVPVAIVASFLGYALSGELSSIAAAVILTIVVAAGAWLMLRGMAAWRATARMTNELLLAVLLATMGTGIFLGGVAGLSLPWSIAGLAVLGGAWLIQRLMGQG